eukprot:Filipodium_phascolosomae@DN4829_c0_g1_i1.p1
MTEYQVVYGQSLERRNRWQVWFQERVAKELSSRDGLTPEQAYQLSRCVKYDKNTAARNAEDALNEMFQQAREKWRAVQNVKNRLPTRTFENLEDADDYAYVQRPPPENFWHQFFDYSALDQVISQGHAWIQKIKNIGSARQKTLAVNGGARTRTQRGLARCRYDLLLNPLGPSVKLISYDNGLILLYKMQQTPAERKPRGFDSKQLARVQGPMPPPQCGLPPLQGPQLILTIRPEQGCLGDKLLGACPLPVGPTNPHFHHLLSFLCQLLPDAIRKWAEQNPQAVELEKLKTESKQLLALGSPEGLAEGLIPNIGPEGLLPPQHNPAALMLLPAATPIVPEGLLPPQHPPTALMLPHPSIIEQLTDPCTLR